MFINATRPYFAVIQTSQGSFVVRLYPQDAPVTVNNFIDLACNNFYNGLLFFRVQKFVVQTGDPTNSGTSGVPYSLPGEANYENWDVGAVGMAASKQSGISGSQFFVLKQADQYLANQNTAGTFNRFGQVIRGMAVVDRLTVNSKITSIRISGAP